jgi:hypothetical protein
VAKKEKLGTRKIFSEVERGTWALIQFFSEVKIGTWALIQAHRPANTY